MPRGASTIVEMRAIEPTLAHVTHALNSPFPFLMCRRRAEVTEELAAEMPAALAAVSFLPEESARSVTEAFHFGPRRWPSTGLLTVWHLHLHRWRAASNLPGVEAAPESTPPSTPPPLPWPARPPPPLSPPSAPWAPARPPRPSSPSTPPLPAPPPPTPHSRPQEARPPPLDILSATAEHVTLLGFDHFREIGGRIHYFDDAHTANHDAACEERICHALAQQGFVRFLL